MPEAYHFGQLNVEVLHYMCNMFTMLKESEGETKMSRSKADNCLVFSKRRIDMDKLSECPKSCFFIKSDKGFKVVFTVNYHLLIEGKIVDAENSLYDVTFASVLDNDGVCIFDKPSFSIRPVDKFYTAAKNTYFWSIYIAVASLMVENEKKCHVINDSIVITELFKDCRMNWVTMIETMTLSFMNGNQTVSVSKDCVNETIILTYVPTNTKFAWIRMDDEYNVSIMRLVIDPNDSEFSLITTEKNDMFSPELHMYNMSYPHSCKFLGKDCTHESSMHNSNSRIKVGLEKDCNNKTVMVGYCTTSE